MKRYIRSSFDASIPDWLRKQLSVGRKGLKTDLISKYRIALDKAKFLDSPTANSLPVYLLNSNWGKIVYIPGVNDDETITINNRTRKLGSVAKSTLKDYIIDAVYVDLDDPNSTFATKERYRDPRYTYRYNAKGEYAGQYKHAQYLGDGKYGPEVWEDSGKFPSNERRARDKSGYRVPSPQEKIAEYYTKFPQRMTDKIDAIYDSIIEVKQELMDADFNGPFDRDRQYNDAALNIASAYRMFSDVISRYRNLLSYLNSNREFRRYNLDTDYYMKEFSNTIAYIKQDLKEIKKMLAQI